MFVGKFNDVVLLSAIFPPVEILIQRNKGQTSYQTSAGVTGRLCCCPRTRESGVKTFFNDVHARGFALEHL